MAKMIVEIPDDLFELIDLYLAKKKIPRGTKPERVLYIVNEFVKLIKKR